MTTTFNPHDLSWIDELAQHDYVVINNFITDEELPVILHYFDTKKANNDLEKAGIGSLDFQINKKIRGDFIYWLNPSQDPILHFYYQKIQTLIDLLNRYCFLSIRGNECHLAYYPPGSFYQKHIDQFKERNNRLVSSILYLNENWTPQDGGELKIYKHQEEITIPPIAKRLILFKSDCIEHEVLTTHAGRKTITGWFLNNPVGLGYLS